MREQRIMDAKQTRQAKTVKPHEHFDDPQQVVADPALSKQDKLEALETLEQDARLLATATEEGMIGGEQSNLRDVLSAKKALESATDATGNPPPDSEAEVAKEVEIEKLDP
jgi:predicted exporter